MAKGDKDLSIKIGTQADTSGLEKATDKTEELTEATKELAEASGGSNPMSMPPEIMGRTEELERQAAATKDLALETKDLAEIEEEARQKQREADVEKAKNLKKQREEAAEAKKALDEVTNLQRVQLVQQFGEGLGRAAVFTRSLAAELQGAGIKGAGLVNGLATGMETVSGAVSGAAAGFAVGGPLGAAIGGTVGLLSGPLKTAITNTVNDLKALKQAEDNAAEAAKGLKAATDAAAAERSRNFLVEYFNKATAAIDAATAAAKRNEALMASRREADNSIRESQAQSAARGGGDPAALERADIAGDFAAERAAIDARVRDLEIVAKDAADKAALLESEIGIKENSGRVDEAELQQIREKAEAARVAANEAQANVDLAIAQADDRIRVASEKLRSDVEASAAKNDEQLAGQAKAIVEMIDTEGAQLTEQQKRAKERVAEVLADGKVTDKELQTLITDLRTLATLMNGKIDATREINRRMGELLQAGTQNDLLLLQLFDSQKKQLNDLKVQLNQRRGAR